MRFIILAGLLALTACEHMPQRNPNYVPQPIPLLPQPYMMPTAPQQQMRRPINCTTDYIRGVAYTNCY